MFCPQCATPNAGDKFCRSCGAALEAVALALKQKSPKPSKAEQKKTGPKTTQDWLEKRIESASGITRGLILLTVSVVIGAAMAVFMPGSFDAPWIVIWSVFFGWMAMWGGVEVAYGISGVVEAKNRLRLLELTGETPALDAASQQVLSVDELPNMTFPSRVLNSSVPRSVTEGTTRQLDEHLEK